MQFLKIEYDSNINKQIAYIFDEKLGRVVKVLVEDYTAGEEQPSKQEEYDRAVEKRPPLRRPKPIIFEDEEEGAEDTGDPHKLPGPLMDLPVKPKSIVPPDMRGLMVEHETPGSDVMTRKA